MTLSLTEGICIKQVSYRNLWLGKPTCIVFTCDEKVINEKVTSCVNFSSEKCQNVLLYEGSKLMNADMVKTPKIEGIGGFDNRPSTSVVNVK